MNRVKNRYCVCSQIRDDARNLPKFIEWYLSQGFEYFVFGDDRSIDNPQSVLKPYIDLGIVQLYSATNHTSDHGRFVGKSYFTSTDIVAFIDVDEFISTKSGFAKNELDLIFSNQDVDIIYLNWVFKHSGSLSSDDLYDYRDSFPYTQADILTKYVARADSFMQLTESELGCHFASGLAYERSRNGSLHNPQFIEDSEQGDIRQRVNRDEHKISKSPSAWQLHPHEPIIWLDHFYTRHFDEFFTYKTILGNKQGAGVTNLIRGIGYYNHGLGKAPISTEKSFNSLNFRRLLPLLQRPKQRELSNFGHDCHDKTVYIHMGLPKTGTSAFQKAMLESSFVDIKTEIRYAHIPNSKFKQEFRNGLDLTNAALNEDCQSLKSTINEYISDLSISREKKSLISAEEFSVLNTSAFATIKQSFSNAGIRSCGIAVIRPFVDFAISFFKQYVNMHVQLEFHTVMTYSQIAESARLHIERTAANCMLCDDYKVINYSRKGLVRNLVDFIYQESDPMDLSEHDSEVNTSLAWATADKLYEIRQGESLQNEFESKEYLRLFGTKIDLQSKITFEHPYYKAVIAEQQMLKQFFSSFPNKHRWEELFSNGD
jgi:hypothetical protein